ncbi:MAG: DUF1674 domain-containing protein [Gammaproteobacteria bacterium]|nr:DUF1674 domain-containing protein [Gammaproteobacteria bacterium]
MSAKEPKAATVNVAKPELPGAPKTEQETPNGQQPPEEFGGYDGPDPTRFGDWQHNGRCTDF